MHLDQERLEQLRVVLIGEYDAVSFFPVGTTSKEGYWYVTTTPRVGQWGAETPNGDCPDLGNKSDETFIKFATENDLAAEIAVYEDGRYNGVDKRFNDWQHLANYLGVSTLVAISTKVPKTVAEKLRYYATRGDGTVSEAVRKLIYGFIAAQIKSNAEKDIFR